MTVTTLSRLRPRHLLAALLPCALPLLMASAPVTEDEMPPVGVYRGDSAVSVYSIGRAVEPLFDREAYPAMGETRAVIVLHNGHLLAERYAPGFGPKTPLISWSLAKTVTALLVGVMVSDGRLALDDPVPLPDWQAPGDPRGAITLRQMLHMASGLQHTETQGPPENTDALRMLVGDGAADQARYAEAKPLAARPGSRFTYSSADTLILADMMTRLLTQSRKPDDRRQAMQDFLTERLAKPVGLAGLTPEYDAAGTMLGGAMMHMTARDYAKIGELLRNKGRGRGGREIVPAAWIDFMTTPSPVNGGYGGQLWLNRPGAEHNLFVGRASHRLFAAVGLRGQYIIVSPTQNLVIVRLGVSSEEELPALKDALVRIVQLFPEG